MNKKIMAQEFRVVECFNCNTFQVNQVTKSSNKWLCKVCNERQSVRAIHYIGIAKDCRQSCQQLNLKRIKKEDKWQRIEEKSAQRESSSAVHQCNDVLSNKWLMFCDISSEKLGSDEETDQAKVQMRDSSTKKRKSSNKKSRCAKKLKETSEGGANEMEYQKRHVMNTLEDLEKDKKIQSDGLKNKRKSDTDTFPLFGTINDSVTSGIAFKLNDHSSDKQQKSLTSKWSRFIFKSSE